MTGEGETLDCRGGNRGTLSLIPAGTLFLPSVADRATASVGLACGESLLEQEYSI